MSEENVELSRQVLTAFNEREIDVFLAHFDPEIEFFALITRMEGGEPYRGHEGMREWWETLTGIFPDFVAEIVEVRADGQATVGQLRLRARGAESNAPIDRRAWTVMKWSDGKLSWWGVFPSEPEALQAAGLSD